MALTNMASLFFVIVELDNTCSDGQAKDEAGRLPWMFTTIIIDMNAHPVCFVLHPTFIIRCVVE